ncbi:hypothetical protein PIB30_007605 [Stylosanthes scabra]|uniref:Uncharacterized protein n=1 Tax=Stylosanthes scabra TaxID=79078 RepID=A0ABU6U501_9FABA|nr:hypothetical protein [Stylosanthes scabra]
MTRAASPQWIRGEGTGQARNAIPREGSGAISYNDESIPTRAGVPVRIEALDAYASVPDPPFGRVMSGRPRRHKQV